MLPLADKTMTIIQRKVMVLIITPF
jgi:hypothetical protein